MPETSHLPFLLFVRGVHQSIHVEVREQLESWFSPPTTGILGWSLGGQAT